MLVSCIIPTRDRPDYLREAVESVLNQTHKELELIIVNDGDTLVPPIPDERVRILNSRRAGAVPARNMGVAAANGETIAWLDDDDVWSAQAFLEDSLDEIRRGCDFVFGDGLLVFDDGGTKYFAENADAGSLAIDNTILISSVCYRKSLHHALGLFDVSLPYYWDWDWYLRVARSGAKLHRVASPVVDIRVHANNMSGDKNLGERRKNLDLLSEKHALGRLELKAHTDFARSFDRN